MFLSKTGRTMKLVGAVAVAVLGIAGTGAANAQQTGTFTDSRDGKIYRTVSIGNLTWMAQNLNHQTANSWCYNDDNSNCAKYGRLYTWNAARSACPAGWKLPANDDWNSFIDGEIGNLDAGTTLKATSGWNDAAGGWDGNGTDDFGFSALPGGTRGDRNRFANLGSQGYWWTATESGAAKAVNWFMTKDYGILDSNPNDKGAGFSVRCVRD